MWKQHRLEMNFSGKLLWPFTEGRESWDSARPGTGWMVDDGTV